MLVPVRVTQSITLVLVAFVNATCVVWYGGLVRSLFSAECLSVKAQAAD